MKHDWDRVKNQLRGQVWYLVEDKVEEKVRDQIEDQVREQIWDWIRR